MIEEQNNQQHVYDNWKAITESDFVTLFIKTWFAFVATLRELYPEHKPYYKASGDSPFISAYKNDFGDKIHFLCSYDAIEENLLKVYKLGFEMISMNYPRFLTADFYQENDTFNESYSEPFESTGGYAGILFFQIKSSAEKIIKASVKCLDQTFLQKVGIETPVIVFLEINYGTILDNIICKLEQQHKPISENGLSIILHELIFDELNEKLTNKLEYLKNSIPEKNNKNVHKVFDVIRSFCMRASERLKISCLNTGNSDKHKLLFQLPVTDLLQKKGKLTKVEKQRAYLWFIGFVYRLRNALFHEIIDPLDSKWQIIFKNAYSVLKQIVDANIARLNIVINLLPKTARLIFENNFINFPSPQIPIEKYDNTTFSTSTELKYCDQRGAKIHIVSTVNCKGKTYHVECDVIWDEKLNDPKIKHVQIKDQEQLTETIMTGNHHEQN